MEENGNKINPVDRVEEIKNRARHGEAGRVTEKICPLMTNGKDQIACTQQCQFYRVGKNGYACPIQELTAISWAFRPRN
ncbi:MAG TPA: hypothetical protein ENH35_05775 [Candidatus Moranbacteria bacterium]|nr:hypothetical protein [Candidatus Moranbacteria bacterium]